jgi:hypothetical protein
MNELSGLELLRAAITHIQLNPREWDQGTYRCGTSMCIGGRICAIAGETWHTCGDFEEYLVDASPGTPFSRACHRCGSPVIYISKRAEQLIGHSRYLAGDAQDDDEFEGDDLFAADNTLSDLLAWQHAYAARILSEGKEHDGQD